MACAVLRTRFLVVAVQYLQVRKSSACYYYRRIPEVAKAHYGGKRFLIESLKTRALDEAAKAIALKVRRDDALWRTLASSGDGEVSATVREDARQLVSAWGKKPGDGRNVAEWHEDPHEDYLEAKYGAEYQRLRSGEHAFPQDQVGELIADLLSPVENEALRLLYEGEAPARRSLSDALKVYLEDHPRGREPKFAAYATRSVRFVLEIVGDLPLPDYSRAIARTVRGAMLKEGWPHRQ